MKESNPIGLAYEGMDVIALLENRLEQYLHGDYVPEQITDITDAIYSVTKTKKNKEVFKVRDDLPPTKITIEVPVNYVRDGKAWCGKRHFSNGLRATHSKRVNSDCCS